MSRRVHPPSTLHPEIMVDNSNFCAASALLRHGFEEAELGTPAVVPCCQLILIISQHNGPAIKQTSKTTPDILVFVMKQIKAE